jgi:hypothetical protein
MQRDSRSAATQGLDCEVESISVNILVEPGRDVALGEDAESSLRVVESLQLGVVHADLVSVRGPSVELGNVAVSGSSEEVLCSSTYGLSAAGLTRCESAYRRADRHPAKGTTSSFR